jgi:competence CoiA-like predicted nuclease
MDNNPRRTIESVLNLETGEEVLASDFFKNRNDEDAIIHRVRMNQERAIQGKEATNILVCYFCKQIIKIKGKPEGEGKTVKYFSHYVDSPDCHIKTNGRYSKDEVQRIKYNGAKESILHITLKEFIANALEQSKGVSDVKIEKVFRELAISKEWKKPDVQCSYLDKKLVFEIQLSTTFLSVIVQREEFYKDHKTFILWIFRNFDLREDLQRFTQKDIIYSNNRNAFVLTDNAKEQSLKKKELILLCHFQVPKLANDCIIFSWESKYVSLSELTFDKNTYRIFFYDSDKEFAILEQKLKEKIEFERVEAQKFRVLREKERRIRQIKENIEPLIELFREFKKTDIEKNEVTRQLSFLNNEELDVLSTTLEEDFGGDLPLWFVLVQSPKSNFTNYILRQENIRLNTNYKIDNLSAFQYLSIMDFEVWALGVIFLKFLKKGYDFSSNADENWIKGKVINYKSLKKEELERIVIFKFIWQLQSPSLIAKLLDIVHIVLPLLSFKLDMVLGSELKNLISVANNFIEYKKDFIELLFSALNLKDTEGVLQKDSFKNKIASYRQNPIDQNRNFDDVFNIILPELKQK